MKVDNIVKNTNEMSFVLSDVDVCIANALRRTILSDIPVVSIQTTPIERNDVTVLKNTSRFNNEVLKQRLSCLPIHITDLETPLEQLQLEVDVENKTSDFAYVTTKDIKIKNTSTEKYLDETTVRDIFPPNMQTGYYIDILRLRPRISVDAEGEHIAFTAKMSINNASVNSMFNVVSTCAYGFTRDMEKIEQERAVKKQQLRDSGMEAAKVEFEMNNWDILDSQRIFMKNSFDFTIRSLGIYDCDEIVKISCDILQERFANIENAIDNNEVEINKTELSMENGFDIKLMNEDHTAGMILQYCLYSMFYEKAETMNYVGFKKFHPHDAFVIVRVSYKEDVIVENVRDDLLAAVTAAGTIFKDMKPLF